MRMRAEHEINAQVNGSVSVLDLLLCRLSLLFDAPMDICDDYVRVLRLYVIDSRLKPRPVGIIELIDAEKTYL